MKYLVEGVKYILILALFGTGGYFLYTQAKPLLSSPCSEPLVYTIGDIDTRFGVSEATLRKETALAALAWNDALGKTLFVEGEEGIRIDLTYSEHQATAELGQTITAEQKAYNAKKAEVEEMKTLFNAAKESVIRLQSSYNKNAAKYQAEVEAWNAKGGAPTPEYERLKQQKETLDADRAKVNKAIDEVNTLAEKLNTFVGELNTLAGAINTKADTYNKNAGVDFEQGEYREASGKKTIEVFEFTTTSALRRVLIHELGHALGLEHIENPESIMYAYNIGEGLSLSEEDLAELRRVCRVQ